MSDTRNQHFVFRGYLRGFSKYKPGKEQKAQVYVSDLVERRGYSTNVRNVAALRDFNRIDVDVGNPNVLEDWLGEFEGEATASIRRVAESQKFEGEDFNNIMNVMALMATNHPSMRFQMTNFIDQLHRKMANIMFANKERYESVTRQMREAEPDREYPDVDYETMRDFIKRDAYDIVPSQNLLVDLGLKGMDAVLPLLGKRLWSIIVADKDAGDFVTSDNPLVLIHTDGSRMPLGFGLRKTMVIFPLTRKVLLTGEFEEPEQVLHANKQIVASYNSIIIDRAMSQVYAYNDSFSYTKRRVLFDGSGLHRDPQVVRERPKLRHPAKKTS